MAILPDLPGLKVEVHAKGSGKLVEYVDEDVVETKPKRSIRYIEATTGKQFAIHAFIDGSYQDKDTALALQVYIDGQHMSGRLFKTEDLKRADGIHCIVRSVKRLASGEQWMKYYFSFSEVSTGTFASYIYTSSWLFFFNHANEKRRK